MSGVPESGEGASSRPRGASVSAAIYAMLACLVGMILAVSLGSAAVPGLTSDLVLLGGLGAVVQLLAAVLFLGRYPGGEDLGAAVGLRATQPALLVLSLPLGVLLQGPAELLAGVVARFFPESPEEQLSRLALLTPRDLLHAGFLVAVLGIFVPVAEEVFFRGALFGGLRRGGRGGRMALLVTSLGFTLSHFDLRSWLPILLVALVLGMLRLYSGSLLCGLFAHVGFNSFSLLLAASGSAQSPLWEDPRVTGGATLAVLLLLPLFVFVSLHSGEAARARLQDGGRARG